MSVGSSEIVVEENSVKDLLSRFKKKESSSPSSAPLVPNLIDTSHVPLVPTVTASAPTITATAASEAAPVQIQLPPSESSVDVPLSSSISTLLDAPPPPSQTNPTIASLKHPSQTSVASSSVTSFASDITNTDLETDTDKGNSFYKAILKKNSGKPNAKRKT